MNVIIRHHNVTHSEALDAHCRDSVVRAVQPFSERVERVEVVFVDQNGTRKGPGHACRIFVRLIAGGAVMFVSEDRDFYVASRRAATGAGRHLARVLAKSRTRAQLRPEPPPDVA